MDHDTVGNAEAVQSVQFRQQAGSLHQGNPVRVHERETALVVHVHLQIEVVRYHMKRQSQIVEQGTAARASLAEKYPQRP